MLARLMDARKGIAVAGAHGKTTTSSMIAFVMEKCGLDPTFIIGGEIVNVGSNAKAGKGEFVVAEADESDGSFLKYRPFYAVVTNIEADHVDRAGKAIVCLDDPHVREALPSIRAGVVTYGIDSPADFTACDIRVGDRRAAFGVLCRGKRLGDMELSVPGRHNVYNALAATIVCLEAGLPFERIAAAIREFVGAKRRFQVIGEACGVLVVDDYAHHPTEIRATIQAAKATGKRIIAVFQPQRYTRTYYLMEQFSRAFHDADEVIVTDIYSPAGERKLEGVSGKKLAERIAENSNERVLHIPSKEEAEEYLLSRVTAGDLVLTMGAGDIWKTARRLVEALERREAAQNKSAR
jgi:UDP-N-acetylmuramate--alanine ligase